MLEEAGFAEVLIGPAVDTFGGSAGEEKARAFAVYSYLFLARRPVEPVGGERVARPVTG